MRRKSYRQSRDRAYGVIQLVLRFRRRRRLLLRGLGAPHRARRPAEAAPVPRDLRPAKLISSGGAASSPWLATKQAAWHAGWHHSG
eukprot:scaffold334_cov241-Pinguiococcus_pyrenoidosus.AAC.19